MFLTRKVWFHLEFLILHLMFNHAPTFPHHKDWGALLKGVVWQNCVCRGFGPCWGCKREGGCSQCNGCARGPWTQTNLSSPAQTPSLTEERHHRCTEQTGLGKGLSCTKLPTAINANIYMSRKRQAIAIKVLEGGKCIAVEFINYSCDTVTYTGTIQNQILALYHGKTLRLWCSYYQRNVNMKCIYFWKESGMYI